MSSGWLDVRFSFISFILAPMASGSSGVSLNTAPIMAQLTRSKPLRRYSKPQSAAATSVSVCVGM